MQLYTIDLKKFCIRLQIFIINLLLCKKLSKVIPIIFPYHSLSVCLESVDSELNKWGY